jgi:hypothetical protein
LTVPRSVKSIAVLFVGNSFTNRNDLPGLLARFALAGQPPRKLVTERVIANGMSLKTHWDRGIATRMIRDRRWDYVVLQDQSTMGLKNPARLKEYAAKFDAECKANKAKTALYMTWARQDAMSRQKEITGAYEEAAREIDAMVIPVGVAWQKVMRINPDLMLYDRDKSHPSLAGTYLAACVFYAKLFGRSPAGMPTEGVSAIEAAALQRAAWQTCSGIKS